MQKAYFDVFLGLVRLALIRIETAIKLKEEILQKEREQLRSTLLSSISHDLRSPLSAMIGSVSSVLELKDSLTKGQKTELLQTTLAEARRLDNYIQKLLDMARLGHGALGLDRAWVGIDDILSVVLRRARAIRNDVEIYVHPFEDLPLLYIHPALVEQGLFNIIENAVRFSPAHSVVKITTYIVSDVLNIDISDMGPGIPVDCREDVFDMFFTFSHGDRYPAGTGLGLAIARGMMRTHGGDVFVVKAEEENGTLIRVQIPLPAKPNNMEEFE